MTLPRPTPSSVNPPSWQDSPGWSQHPQQGVRSEGSGRSSSKQARVANLERLISAARERGDRDEYEHLIAQQARFCGSIDALEELAETYPLHRAIESIQALDQDRLARTRQLLDSARKGGLRSPYEIEVMARCYVLVGDFGVALDMFDELLEQNAGEGHIHRYRGVCLLAQGAWVLSQYAFEDALGLDPLNALAFRGKGEALIQVGPLDQAIHFLRKALQKAPRDAHTYFLLGEALYALGHVRESSVAYSRSVRLAPLNKRNIHRHARTLMQLGRSDEAVRVLDTAHGQDLNSARETVQRALWSDTLDRERQAAADQAAKDKARGANGKSSKGKRRSRKRRKRIRRWLLKSLYPY